jgi:hypothetical protein
MSKFAVKPWLDYHRVPTLFLVVDEDCELGRFPSEAEAISNAAALAEESRSLQELGTAASGEVADVLARYRTFLESLPSQRRERLLAEAQDVLAERDDHHAERELPDP